MQLDSQIFLGLLVGLTTAVACTGEDPPEPIQRPGPPGTPQPLPPPDLVVRAAGVQALSFSTTTHPLPRVFEAADRLHFAVQDDGRILVGGDRGLFVVGATTSSISALAVRDVFESRSVGFLVATDEGVFVYDGTLLPSQLDDALDGDRIAHFTPRGDALWFASGRRLYELEAMTLHAFDEMDGVAALATFDGGDIAVETATAGFSLLVETAGGEWQQLPLGEEVTLSSLAPGAGGRVLGVTEGRLVERVVRARDDVRVWRRVSIVDDAMDPGAVDIQRLVVDPNTGAVWVIQERTASQIMGDRVGTVDLPSSFGSTIGARVTNDGALWLADGAVLLRIGSDEPPLSFASQVAPFGEKNCARCHAPMLGISTLVLESADDWRTNIDGIIEQVEAGRMPLDAMPLLGGGSDLPRRWLSGGMQP